MIKKYKPTPRFPIPVITNLVRSVRAPIDHQGRKGGGSSQPPPPIEAPNTLQSNQYVRIIDVLGEGQIGGLVNGLQSIYFDSTPIQNPDGSINFSGVAVDTRVGLPIQDPLAGFPTAETENTVGTQLKAGVPQTRTILNKDVDGCRVTVGTPQLAISDPNNGNINGTNVHVQVHYRSNGGDWQLVVDNIIEGKTNSRYQRAFYFGLAGEAPFDIKVTRITPDSDSTYLRNDLFFDTYTEIINSRMCYPNTALVAVQMSAEQFANIPKRAYDVRGLYIQVPSNYDPDTASYNGVWDGSFKLAISSNPAWVFYDIVTNPRYGMGEFVSTHMIDKWALYDISQYCDEMVINGRGGYERRYVCNLVISEPAEAFTVVNNIASIFRGMAYWCSGQIIPTADKPTDPTSLFTNANVIEGSFTYQGSDRRTRHTVALVTWKDQTLFGEDRIAYVEDPEGIALYGVQETSMVAVGCTSESQAIRIGRWILYTERLETEVCSFSVGLDGSWIYPNAVIKIADSNRAGERTGGRVISVNGSQITLDAPIDIGTQTLTLSLPDNTVRTTQIKTFISDTVIDINDEGFSVMPEPMSIWVAARGAVNSTTWRVVSVAESDKGILQVTALTHNPSKYKYVEENIAIETPPDNSIGLPKPVKDLTLVESLYFGEGNTINVRGTLSWSSKEPYFVVRWREYEGTWTSREVSVTSIDIPLAVGDWEFEVLALNVLGVRGEAVLLQQYIYGKTKPPSTVQNVKVDILPDNVIVSWDSVPDIDLDVYEVRLGEDWDLAKVIGDAKVNFLFLSPMIAGTYTVHVRAKDYEPLYSQESGTATFTIVMPSTPEVETKLSNGDVTFSWNLPVSSHRIISYELWETISDVSSKFLENKKLVKNRNDYSLSLVAQFSGLSYTMQVIWEGEKIFFVRALDVAGNVSYDGEATVTINKPIMPSISNQVIDNNVLLRWQGSQNTVSRFADTYTSGARLPIKYYNFKSGKFIDESAPQWDDGNIKDMGRITGEFTMVYETTGGRYRYFLQAVDTGGNVSDIGYSDALVDQPPDFNLWVDQDSYLTEPLAWTSNALYIANKNSSGYIYESGFLAPLGGISNTWGAHFLQHQWRTIRDKVNDGYPVYNELYAGKLTWKSHYEQFDYKTPKDQIDAGFPIYLQPTDMVPAIYEHEFDFGVALPSLRFDVALDKENRYGETSVRIDIAVKANIEDNWLEEIDTDYMVLPESSRYIKIRITVTSDEDRLSYALFRKMNMSLAAKYKTDQGEIDVPEEGISVNFGVAFVDVISVNATARGEAPVYCAVDFLDEPYPKDFKIYAFDSTGKPTQAHVTWSARGF